MMLPHLLCFQNEVASAMESHDFEHNLLGDPTINYTMFEDIISKAKSKHLQPKTVRFKRYKHKISPWLTKAILVSIKLRDKLFCKLKSTPETAPHYLNLEHSLSEYKKLLKRIIQFAKTKYYAEQFEKNKANSRHIRATVKYILNRNKIKKESSGYFTLGEAIIKEPRSVANHFNDFFAGVGPRLSNEISNTETKSVSTYQKQTIMTSFTFDCVSESRVMDVIKTLATKNSTGIDSISSNMLKKTCSCNNKSPDSYNKSVAVYRYLPTSPKDCESYTTFQEKRPPCIRYLSSNIITIIHFENVRKGRFQSSIWIFHK